MKGPAADSGSNFSIALGGESGDIKQKEYTRYRIITVRAYMSERVNEMYKSLILKSFWFLESCHL